MTKRYFYTDPLAAAWMAQHFEMKILAPVTKANGDSGESDRPLPVWCWGRKVEQALSDRDFISERYYIHAESVGRLAPKVDDVCLLAEDGEPDTHQYIWDLDLIAQGVHQVKRILQREGVVFHWPESEDVE